MAQSSEERFLSYYNNELTYLRNAGALFATEHPKIARRLEMSDQESPDPHVERLIESFAFLTARISQELDNRMPEVASALLGVLYPALVSPIPSMSMASFQVDPTKGKLNRGHVIEKGTPLIAQGREGTSCQFQTVYPLTLWPVSVSEIRVVPARDVNFDQTQYVLKVSLLFDGVDLSDVELDTFLFHLYGESALVHLIFEDVYRCVEKGIIAEVPGEKPVYFPHMIENVGLEADETSWPKSPYGTHALQLFMEYFHFPEKFQFMRLSNMQRLREKINMNGNRLNLYMPLKDGHMLVGREIPTSTLRLDCTPIINLFSCTTDPLRLDPRQSQHRLIPDQRYDKTQEIYAIQSVHARLEGGEEMDYTPYFSARYHQAEAAQTVYWLSQRKPAFERGIPGSDTYLSFVDLHLNQQSSAQPVIFAKTLCTNRYLAEQVPAGARLTAQDRVPASQITCLYKPTAQVYAPTDGETLWRLISQLSTHHLWLTQNDQALDVLRHMLQLYGGTAHNPRLQDLSLIKRMETSRVVRRFGEERWRGFVEGVFVRLHTSTASSSGTPCFMFTQIFQKFFSLFVNINSFVELGLCFDEKVGDWMIWPFQPGSQRKL